jgi:hypothetical protein
MSASKEAEEALYEKLLVEDKADEPAAERIRTRRKKIRQLEAKRQADCCRWPFYCVTVFIPLLWLIMWISDTIDVVPLQVVFAVSVAVWSIMAWILCEWGV